MSVSLSKQKRETSQWKITLIRSSLYSFVRFNVSWLLLTIIFYKIYDRRYTYTLVEFTKHRINSIILLDTYSAIYIHKYLKKSFVEIRKNLHERNYEFQLLLLNAPVTQFTAGKSVLHVTFNCTVFVLCTRCTVRRCLFHPGMKQAWNFPSYITSGGMFELISRQFAENSYCSK